MTIFATTCFAFAVIRFVEECLKYIVSCIYSLTSGKKETKSLNPEYKRLTVNITPELHELIKAHCVKSGVTITQYTFNAVVAKLKEDNVLSITWK